MKKLRELLPGGLEWKLIRSAVIFVVILGIVFLAMSRIQNVQLSNEVKIHEGERSEFIKGEYTQSMNNVTSDSLLQLSIWAADKTDDEFWIIDHDLRVLARQVEEIYRHPENYERLPVRKPEKKNDGDFVLQLLCSGNYEDIDPHTLEMMEKLANLGPMMKEIVKGNEGYTLECFITTPDDVTLAMDDLSAGKLDENGDVRNYAPTNRPWYKGAVELQEMYVSPPTHSYFYDFTEMVFAYPVYVDGDLVAVLEASTHLGVLERKLEERKVGENGFSMIVNQNGQIVCSLRTDGELSMREDPTEDIRKTINPKLTQIINHGLAGKIDIDIVEIDGDQFFAAHAPLETVHWTQVTFASLEELRAPTDKLLLTMEDSTAGMLKILGAEFKKHFLILVISLFVIMNAMIFSASLYAKRSVRPVQKMTEEVSNFFSKDMDFNMKDEYRTGDEFEKLAESFETMSVRMKEYVKEIVENASEKERLETEMEAAKKIQMKMLPKRYPDYYNKPGYELFAKMVPAVNVGGDLYDFYYLDEDHLVIMVGDVSGKGISAALFMVLCKQMIKSQMLLQGGDVVAAITESNLRLIEEATEGMFVTVWLGVVTLSTGVLEFVNAGHNYAAIRHGDGDFVIETDEHSPLVGALSFIKYSRNVMKLNVGDTLYIYTDGVTEAHNENEEMFGQKRMLEALNEGWFLSVGEIDSLVRNRVNDFCGDAEQYDDITTLVFKYTGIDETV